MLVVLWERLIFTEKHEDKKKDKKNKIGRQPYCIHLSSAFHLELHLYMHNFCLMLGAIIQYKVDGVGPIDNRPSTEKLHHFVTKKRRKKM